MASGQRAFDQSAESGGTLGHAVVLTNFFMLKYWYSDSFKILFPGRTMELFPRNYRLLFVVDVMVLILLLIAPLREPGLSCSYITWTVLFLLCFLFIFGRKLF